MASKVVRVVVTLRLETLGSESLDADVASDAARQAVKNACERAESEGFEQYAHAMLVIETQGFKAERP